MLAAAPTTGTRTQGLEAVLETEDWETIRTPPIRSITQFVFDESKAEGVLFGDDFGTDRGSAWVWNGHNFIEHAVKRGVPSPTPRTSHSFAWDPARKNVVLFGGSSSNIGLLDDTWIWNGRTWTRVEGEPHPGPRADAIFVWDDERKNLVLYGGQGPSGRLTETWTFDGSRWVFAYANAPPERTDAAIAWSPVLKSLVLFGGTDGQPLSDTWLWNGKDWRASVSVPSPTARSQAALRWDESAQKLVLFGGVAKGNLAIAGTALFDGKKWEPIAGQEPPARKAPQVVWDDERKELVLFGGTALSSSALSDTWVFRKDHWEERPKVGPVPAGRTRASFTWDPWRKHVLLFGGSSDFNFPGDAWTWNGTRWSLVSAPSVPSGRYNHQMAPDKARQQLVLFGGSNGFGLLEDTWLWNGSAWTALEWSDPFGVQPHPAGRTGHSMAWDDERKYVILFGGSNGLNALTDTWTWDGAKWTERVSAVRPPARTNGALAFDPTSKRIVLVGGNSAFGGRLNDSWTWDGTTWAATTFDFTFNDQPVMGLHQERGELVLVGANTTWTFNGSWIRRFGTPNPTGMSGHALTWDPVRKNLLLTGGNNSVLEAWTWNGNAWTNRTPAPASAPPRRTFHAAFWDPIAEAVRITGGFGANQLDDTWAFDGTRWKLAQPSLDPFDRFPRFENNAPLLLHEPSRRPIRFGGTTDQGDASNETWTFQTRGGSCTTGAQCASGFCVDHVCCGQASCGICETCADPASPGRCASITREEDPDTCPASDRKTCNREGRCVRALGAECTQSRDCASGFCASPFPGTPMVGPNKGLCCDKACDGQCEACAAGLKLSQKDDGVCGVANVGTNPGLWCKGESTCNSRAECGPEPTAYCKDAQTLVQKDGSETMCGRYRCENGACLSRCVNDQQCGFARHCSPDGFCDLGSDSGCSANSAGGDGPSNIRVAAAGLIIALGLLLRRAQRVNGC